MTDYLETLANKTPEQVFADETLNQLVKDVEAEAASFSPDLLSKEGRAAIASKAYSIAQLKNHIDKVGKELGTEWKTKLDGLNKKRSNVWDKFEVVQKAIRAPLDQWENSETARMEGLKTRMMQLQACATLPNSADIAAINAAYEEMRRLYQFNWEEMLEIADQEVEKITVTLDQRKAERSKYEVEQAELVRLRDEANARKVKEEAEAIAKASADKARLEAEEKAAREKRDADEKVEKIRFQLEKEKRDADERALQAERDRIATEEKAAKDRIAAEEKAAADRIAAVAAEAKAKLDAEEHKREIDRQKHEAEIKAAHDAILRLQTEEKLQQAHQKIEELEKNKIQIPGGDVIYNIIAIWGANHNLALTQDMIEELQTDINFIM